MLCYQKKEEDALDGAFLMSSFPFRNIPRESNKKKKKEKRKTTTTTTSRVHFLSPSIHFVVGSSTQQMDRQFITFSYSHTSTSTTSTTTWGLFNSLNYYYYSLSLSRRENGKNDARFISGKKGERRRKNKRLPENQEIVSNLIERNRVKVMRQLDDSVLLLLTSPRKKNNNWTWMKKENFPSSVIKECYVIATAAAAAAAGGLESSILRPWE